MSDVQKYKIVDLQTEQEVFFCDRVFTSAYNQVRDFLIRNKARSYQVFCRNLSQTGPTWTQCNFSFQEYLK